MEDAQNSQIVWGWLSLTIIEEINRSDCDGHVSAVQKTDT